MRMRPKRGWLGWVPVIKELRQIRDYLADFKKSEAEKADAGRYVYFFHIPKTSGTSVREFLAQAYGEDRVTPVATWDHLMRGIITPRTRVVCGHFGGILPLWLRSWPQMVTMLRDPVARTLSSINHVQRDPTHVLHAIAVGLSVKQYCEHPVLRRTVRNVQASYLASLAIGRAVLGPELTTQPFGWRAVHFDHALDALDQGVGLRDEARRAIDTIDGVGLREAHGPSLQLFAKVLGVELTPSLHEVRVNVGSDGWRLSDLTPADRTILREVNECDLDVYEYARKKFVDQCKRYGIALDARWTANEPVRWAARS